MFAAFKTILPRGLYGRAALILVVPVVTIQLVVSVTFIQRHFEGVTRQLTSGMVGEIALLQNRMDEASDLAEAVARARNLSAILGLDARLGGDAATADDRGFWDWSGREVIATLRAALPGLDAVELEDEPRRVRITAPTNKGPLVIVVDRTRVSASNPHQLLVLMLATSVLMTLVAFVFLRNQLRPIKRLAAAASAFGRGQHVPYRPRGASEVRAAGTAFLDMRNRLERQIEQRTLMLSGVSHDLRTPLTRMRLGLSMLPEDGETRALLADVSDMQRLVDEFLAFARGDALEEPEETDPGALVRRVVENAQRAGQAVSLGEGQGGPSITLRPMALTRALENLIGNAIRYGSRAVVSVTAAERAVRFAVEDDGPGIPKGLRDEALTPFMRLDTARDPNRGGGVGLGLSIAADIARAHGGQIRLGESAALGGLKAEIVIGRAGG